jgi:hypothetical protein
MTFLAQAAWYALSLMGLGSPFTPGGALTVVYADERRCTGPAIDMRLDIGPPRCTVASWPPNFGGGGIISLFPILPELELIVLLLPRRLEDIVFLLAPLFCDGSTMARTNNQPTVRLFRQQNSTALSSGFMSLFIRVLVIF